MCAHGAGAAFPQPLQPSMSRLPPPSSHPQKLWLEIGGGPLCYLTLINNPSGAQEVLRLLRHVQAFGHRRVITTAFKLET